MRVEADLDVCEANAVCTGIVPEVFALDDEDVLHIRAAEVAREQEHAVRQAVNSCPKLALSLSEE